MILIKPIITEKAMLATSSGRYIFKVDRKANKVEIAQAIFENFKVKPVKVNIISIHGENRLIKGRIPSKTKDWKKAIVTLKKGDKLPGFEEK